MRCVEKENGLLHCAKRQQQLCVKQGENLVNWSLCKWKCTQKSSFWQPHPHKQQRIKSIGKEGFCFDVLQYHRLSPNNGMSHERHWPLSSDQFILSQYKTSLLLVRCGTHLLAIELIETLPESGTYFTFDISLNFQTAVFVYPWLDVKQLPLRNIGKLNSSQAARNTASPVLCRKTCDIFFLWNFLKGRNIFLLHQKICLLWFSVCFPVFSSSLTWQHSQTFNKKFVCTEKKMAGTSTIVLMMVLFSLMNLHLVSGSYFPTDHQIGWDGIWGSWGEKQVCVGGYATKVRFLAGLVTLFSGNEQNAFCFMLQTQNDFPQKCSSATATHSLTSDKIRKCWQFIQLCVSVQTANWP